MMMVIHNSLLGLVLFLFSSTGLLAIIRAISLWVVWKERKLIMKGILPMPLLGHMVRQGPVEAVVYC